MRQLGLQRASHGLSLVELLIAMVIGVVVALAITGALIRNETSQRNAVSARGSAEAGSRTVFFIDRAIRNAGSGFAQSWQDVVGCRLEVSQDGTQVLPVTPGASSAFASLNAGAMQVRLVPIVIGKGLADTSTETRGDVLMVMSGTAGSGGAVSPVGSVAENVMVLPSTLGYGAGDLILLSGESAAGGCVVRQVGATSPAAGLVALAGRYSGATGTTTTDPGALARPPIALQLGSESNPPQFDWYGVGRNHTLFRYDLLKKASDGAEQAVADGVTEVRALYGVDSGNPSDHGTGTWVDPSGAEYGADALTSGSVAAQRRLRSIVSIKVAFILRASPKLREDLAAEGAVTLFSGVRSADGSSLEYTRKFNGADLGYRYRTVEVTVPLRNVLMAAPS